MSLMEPLSVINSGYRVHPIGLKWVGKWAGLMFFLLFSLEAMEIDIKQIISEL